MYQYSEKAVTLERIAVDELKKYITIGFEDDPELISKIHISPGTLEHCVNHNFNTVKDAEANNGEFYKVMSGVNEIGFVVAIREPNLVPSFGINIHHRRKETLFGFLQALKDLFNGDTYMVCVWDKNERAINFFRRNGFNFHHQDKMVLLWA